MSTKMDLRQSVLRTALSMAGSAANATADSILPLIDAELAKLFEDRNLLLVSDGTITFPSAGTTITFSSNLRLHVNSQVAGGSPTTIDLGSTTRTLSASGKMVYAVINRIAGTATVTDDSSTLPAVTSANQEVVLIAKRVDATDGTKRVYFRNGFTLSAGQTARFGQGGTTFASEFSVVDSTDTTKKLIAQLTGSATGTTLTLASAITLNRTLTFPDITDTLVSRTNTEALTNKQLSYSSTSDSATTGTNTTLGAFTTGIVRLTNGSLSSISGVPAGNSGQFLIIENKTGNQITINNEEATATAANRIQTGTSSNVSMPNNAAFAFTYDSTSSRWQLTAGSGSGSGSGGTKNYLSAVTTSQSSTPNTGNGNFELGSTTGWSLAHSALTSNFPSTVATAGNAFSSAGGAHGGSAASGNLSISAVSSGQLAGSYSLSSASTAATTAGDMLISDAFNIDTEDQAKVLGFSFAYKAQTNPSNGNFSGTSSNSFGVAIYDVTNAQWIMPAGVWNLVQSSGVGISKGTFQTSSNGTQYQIAVFNANASSGAITLYFDDFYVGPQITASGAAAFDEVDESSLFTFDNIGTPTNVKVFTSRVGDKLLVRGTFQPASVPVSVFAINLPGKYAINTSNFPSNVLQKVGEASTTTSGSTTLYQGGDGYIVVVDSSLNGKIFFSNSTTSNAFTKVNSNTFATTSPVVFNFVVPISGWSSQTVSSADTDTRITTMRANNLNSIGSISSGVNFIYTSKDWDTHGAYNTSTGNYTAPVSGYYRVTHAFYSSGGNYSYISVNGGAESARLGLAGGTFIGVPVSSIVKVNAGDTISVKASGTVVISNDSTSYSYLEIERLSGPAVVQATESVNCRYTSTSSQSISNSSAVVVNFDTKDFDSHNAVTTGASWKFTAPVSGKYRLDANILFAVNSSGERILYVSKNGGSNERLTSVTPGAASYGSLAAGRLFNLLAGDYIQVSVEQTSGGSLTLTSADAIQQISIYRVGN